MQSPLPRPSPHRPWPLRGLLAILALVLAGGSGDAAAGPKDPPPQAPPGIAWETSVAQAWERSKREGRPLLVCVNALEDERANIQLATQLYPSEAWGRATRAYVALVANPNEHAAAGSLCSRYGHAPCACHKETLAWVLSAFAPDGALISPQHLIVEPDGAIAYRKEYFTGEEGPALFETYLSMLAPLTARRIARLDRETRLAELSALPVAKVGPLARAWLAASEDGLSAAGVLCALDDASAADRRRALIEALAETPPAQALVLVPAAEGTTLEPDLESAEARAWVRTLLAVRRDLGVWAAARVLARTKEPALRKSVLEAWLGEGGVAQAGALPAGERAALEEALRLAGQPVPPGVAVADSEGTEDVPLVRRQRARARSNATPSALPAALVDAAPGALRRALLDAAAEDVSRRLPEIVGLLRQAPARRVRIAAALALLRAKEGPGEEIARVLLDGLVDPLEGPEVREQAVARLGDDPGEDLERWEESLKAAFGGAR